jgi:hypothetical protein
MVRFLFKFFVGLALFVAVSNSAAAPPDDAVKALKPSLSHFHAKQVLLNARSQPAGLPQRAAVEITAASFSQAGAGEKSKGRAFLQSLILPGWGQHYARSHTMLKVFAASEVLLWGTFAGFNLWSNWLQNDYRTFAVSHAGVDLGGKSAKYFVDIGDFNDIFEYNQAQLRNRAVSTLYPETDEFFWRWDSEDNRRRFEDLRIRSDRAANRAELTLAVIFVNHLVSALQATLAVHKYNQRLQKNDIGMNLEVDALAENLGVRLKLVQHF